MCRQLWCREYWLTSDSNGCKLPCVVVQSDANEKFNELEEQVQQIKKQIKVRDRREGQHTWGQHVLLSMQHGMICESKHSTAAVCGL